MTMQRIMVRVNAKKSGELCYQWQVVGAQSGRREWASIAAFKAFVTTHRLEGAQVLLVLPSHWASHHGVATTKQQRKHLRTAGLFLIEEGVAEDVADIHHGWSHHGDHTLISTIARELLSHILDDWSDLPVNVVGVIAELHLLPDEPHHLWAFPLGWIYRGANLADVMTGQPKEWPSFQAMIHDESLRISVFDSFPGELDDTRSSVLRQSWLHYLIENWRRMNFSTQIGNWCWGDYRMRTTHYGAGFNWRPLAIAASVAAVAFLSHRIGVGVYYHGQADDYRAEITEVYQTMFPGAKPPRLLRREVEGRLSQRQGGGGAFWTVFASTAQQLNAQRARHGGPKALIIKRMTYDERQAQLRLELDAANVAVIEGLQDAVREQGLMVETGRLNQEQGRVKARVTVRA